jgi:hypothetical protein
MLTATKAEKMFIRVDVETRRSLRVKRAKADERSTATAALEVDPSRAAEVS